MFTRDEAGEGRLSSAQGGCKRGMARDVIVAMAATAPRTFRSQRSLQMPHDPRLPLPRVEPVVVD